MAAITKLPFPNSKKGMQQFLGSLNYCSRFIQDFAVYGAALYQLKEDDFYEGDDLIAAKERFTALQQNVAEVSILRHFDAKKEVHIMLRILKDAEMNYHSAEMEVLALLLLIK
ncbi:hypothetical protein PHMEG_00031237, partial [Phytophthora megakarya]